MLSLLIGKLYRNDVLTNFGFEICGFEIALFLKQPSCATMNAINESLFNYQTFIQSELFTEYGCSIVGPVEE